MPLPDSMGRLEPNLHDSYRAWKADPSPDNIMAVIGKAQPSIDNAIRQHVGKITPMLRSEAKQIVIGSLGKYDPSMASFGTHLTNQLQGLKRISRNQRTVLSVPERVALDRQSLVDVTREIQDKLGRPPSDVELSDYSGFSSKRIQHVRRFVPGVAESALSGDEGDPASVRISGAKGLKSAWMQLVYEDLVPVDQRILEHTLGLHGKPQLSNQALASTLGLSPGAISQRKAKIQQMLDQEEELSPFGN